MSVGLYMDEHVHSAITSGLRSRAVDVMTVQQDGYVGRNDRDVLDRAAALGRMIFTNDTDFLQEATRHIAAGSLFAGIIYAHPLRVSIGQCVLDLELLAAAGTADELIGRVTYLPLQ